jgi:hypothetical protein
VCVYVCVRAPARVYIYIYISLLCTLTGYLLMTVNVLRALLENYSVFRKGPLAIQQDTTK